MDKSDVTVKGFIVDRLLGEGAYATVYLCRKPFSRKRFAAKIITHDKDIYSKFQAENEIEILKSLNHHGNIVRLQGVVREENKIISILEHINGCNLFEGVLRWYKFTEDDLKTVIRQLFKALAYCEENRIVHRDIGPENILLANIPAPGIPSRNSVLKLIDFNLSRKIPEGKSNISVESNGNPSYMAPETISDNPVYSFKSDIWSAGVILFVLAGGYPPFWDDNYNHLLQNVIEANYVMPMELWDYVDNAVVDLIKKILVTNFRNRPSANDVLANNWMNTRSSKTNVWIGRDRLSAFLCHLKQQKKKNNHRAYKLTMKDRAPFHPDIDMLITTKTNNLDSNNNISSDHDENNNNVIIQSYW